MRIQASFSRVCRRCAPCPDFGKPFRHAARRETALHNTSCIVSDFMILFSTIVTAKQTARPAAPIAYPAPRKDIRGLYFSHPVILFSAPARGSAGCPCAPLRLRTLPAGSAP